jgi:hypothetical protein
MSFLTHLSLPLPYDCRGLFYLVGAGLYNPEGEMIDAMTKDLEREVRHEMHERGMEGGLLRSVLRKGRSQRQQDNFEENVMLDSIMVVAAWVGVLFFPSMICMSSFAVCIVIFRLLLHGTMMEIIVMTISILCAMHCLYCMCYAVFVLYNAV